MTNKTVESTTDTSPPITTNEPDWKAKYEAMKAQVDLEQKAKMEAEQENVRLKSEGKQKDELIYTLRQENVRAPQGVEPNIRIVQQGDWSGESYGQNLMDISEILIGKLVKKGVLSPRVEQKW